MQLHCASRKMWNFTQMTNKQPVSSSSQKARSHQKQSTKVKSLWLHFYQCYFYEMHFDGMFPASTLCWLCFSTSPCPQCTSIILLQTIGKCNFFLVELNGLESTWSSTWAMYVCLGAKHTVHKDMLNSQKCQTICSREGDLHKIISIKQ